MTAETQYQLGGDMYDADGGVLPLNSSSYNYTLADSGDSAGRANDSDELSSYEYETRSVPEIVAVVVVVVALSLVTSAGNLLVIISFKVDVQLQTVSNYFLLSLSVADLTIGLVSMPLYSVYLLMGYWPLGHVICDAWLCLDYTMSNASVANLLVISFDRYFSVTRPLTYRVRRTSGRAAAMIAGAWMVSALLWTPWIIAWPYLEGGRMVPPLECYVQFLKTNKYFTIMTATAAFYLPVLIMTILYFRIYRETEKRQKGLAELQGGTSGGSLPLLGGRFVRRSNDDSGKPKPPAEETVETMTRFGRCYRRLTSLFDFFRRRRRQNEVTAMYSKSQTVSVDGSCDDVNTNADQNRPRFAVSNASVTQQHPQRPLNVVVQTEQAQAAQTSDTGMAMTVGRLFGLQLKSNAATTQVRADIAAGGGADTEHAEASTPLISTGNKPTQVDCPDGSKFEDAVHQEDSQNDNKVCQDDQPEVSDGAAADGHDAPHDPSAEITPLAERPLRFVGERRPAMTLHRVALQACMAAKLSQAVRDRRERRRHQQEKKAERKAARTLSAVLLAFIVTWTPYNVFIIVEAFCTDCVNPTLYAIGTCFTVPATTVLILRPFLHY